MPGLPLWLRLTSICLRVKKIVKLSMMRLCPLGARVRRAFVSYVQPSKWAHTWNFVFFEFGAFDFSLSFLKMIAKIRMRSHAARRSRSPIYLSVLTCQCFDSAAAGKHKWCVRIKYVGLIMVDVCDCVRVCERELLCGVRVWWYRLSFVRIGELARGAKEMWRNHSKKARRRRKRKYPKKLEAKWDKDDCERTDNRNTYYNNNNT